MNPKVVTLMLAGCKLVPVGRMVHISRGRFILHPIVMSNRRGLVWVISRLDFGDKQEIGWEALTEDALALLADKTIQEFLEAT